MRFTRVNQRPGTQLEEAFSQTTTNRLGFPDVACFGCLDSDRAVQTENESRHSKRRIGNISQNGNRRVTTSFECSQ